MFAPRLNLWITPKCRKATQRSNTDHQSNNANFVFGTPFSTRSESHQSEQEQLRYTEESQDEIALSSDQHRQPASGVRYPTMIAKEAAVTPPSVSELAMIEIMDHLISFGLMEGL